MITVMPIALMRASGTGLLIILILTKMGGLFADFAFSSSSTGRLIRSALETVCRSICPAVCLTCTEFRSSYQFARGLINLFTGGGTASSRIGHKFRLNGCQRRTVLRY